MNTEKQKPAQGHYPAEFQNVHLTKLILCHLLPLSVFYRVRNYLSSSVHCLLFHKHEVYSPYVHVPPYQKTFKNQGYLHLFVHKSPGPSPILQEQVIAA